MSDTETAARLLEGPALHLGAESFAGHEDRLGARPLGRPETVELLRQSHIGGRGGAGFPMHRKWRSLAQHHGNCTVVVNGAEAEPLSQKDRVLMAGRPHLVIDGAFIAAETVGAREIIFYIRQRDDDAFEAVSAALGERSDAPCRTRVIEAPNTYVAGEETAAVNFIDNRKALPTGVKPFVRGVNGFPSLVQNAETLAQAALATRRGPQWFRALGNPTPGTALITVSVSGEDEMQVMEIAYGTGMDAVTAIVDGNRNWQAALIGGYAGGWTEAIADGSLSLDPATLQERGLHLGAGVVHLLDAATCGVAATAAILAYLAHASAQQCGPCKFGLPAIAEVAQRLARNEALPHDLQRLGRWAGQVRGRGACHHPDGAARVTESALRVFGEDYRAHQSGQGCIVAVENVA